MSDYVEPMCDDRCDDNPTAQNHPQPERTIEQEAEEYAEHPVFAYGETMYPLRNAFLAGAAKQRELDAKEIAELRAENRMHRYAARVPLDNNSAATIVNFEIQKWKDRSEYMEQKISALTQKLSDAVGVLKEEHDYWLDQCEMCLDTNQDPQWCREMLGRIIKMEAKLRAEKDAQVNR